MSSTFHTLQHAQTQSVAISAQSLFAIPPPLYIVIVYLKFTWLIVEYVVSYTKE